MTTLRIEHKIASYESWKKAFDSDPINRKKSGVKRYRIYRPMNDDNFVIIDLDFEHREQAEATRVALQKIFPKIEGHLISGIELKIFSMVETTVL